jgi:hypothetical protein
MGRRRRVRIVAVVSSALLAGGGIYAAVGALGAGDSPAVDAGLTANARPGEVDRALLARLPSGAEALVRGADPLTPRLDGQLYELTRTGEPRPAGRLRCKVAHASAAGRGLCLRLGEGDDETYEAVVFDGEYRPLRRRAIQGVPDRARVSRDGRLGAYTAFDEASAAGYFANAADFSTDTRILDLETGTPVLRLGDQLDVTRDGRRFVPVDAQFWGVTFGAGDRFYATMGTDFDHYLIQGDVSSRRARVVAKRVECPALSPDGRRIAYKRRIPYTDRWRFHVLDLRSGADVALAERRSIDDQPEWWGSDRIAYSDDRTAFTVPADGSGEPRRLAARAAHPTFVGAAP